MPSRPTPQAPPSGDMPADVAAVFAAYPPAPRRRLFTVRDLILDTATALDIGPIQETLKWGEPSYLTKPRVGTTIRIAWKPAAPDRIGLYVNCQTTLVETFRAQFPDAFEYQGNRAMLLRHADPLPHGPLQSCIAAALTYHTAKRRAS